MRQLVFHPVRCGLLLLICSDKITTSNSNINTHTLNYSRVSLGKTTGLHMYVYTVDIQFSVCTAAEVVGRKTGRRSLQLIAACSHVLHGLMP